MTANSKHNESQSRNASDMGSLPQIAMMIDIDYDDDYDHDNECLPVY